MEDNYKKKYYQMLKCLTSLNNRLVYDRCPPFKQCCGACIALKAIIKTEKKENDKDNPRSTESDE